jgi:hypothetical protein
VSPWLSERGENLWSIERIPYLTCILCQLGKWITFCKPIPWEVHGIKLHAKRFFFTSLKYKVSQQIKTNNYISTKFDNWLKYISFLYYTNWERSEKLLLLFFNTWPLWKNSSLRVVHVVLECWKLLSNPYYALLIRQSFYREYWIFWVVNFHFFVKLFWEKFGIFFFSSVNCEFSAKKIRQFCEIHFSIKKHA